MSTPRHLRRWILAGLVAAVVAGVILAVASVFSAGVGWDSAIEVSMANGVLHSLPPTLQEAYDATPYLFEFYGTINYFIVEHLGSILTPGFTLDSTDPGVYLWLGVWNVVIGVAGVAGLSYAVGRALSSSIAGWALAALTMTTPLWVGHLSMNFKDVPTAVGLSLVTAGLVLAWLPAPKRLEWLAAGALIALGTAELIGSRAGGTVLLGPLVIGAWVLSLFRRRVVATSFIAVMVGLGIVWLQSPFARRGMIRWLADAATTSNINPSPLRFAGSDISSGALPLTYIPTWFLAQLPILTTALLVGGLVVLALGLLNQVGFPDRRTLYPLTPVALQALALPAMIAASHAIIYDAARHVLFALPALLVLAVLPIHWALTFHHSRRWLRGGAVLLTAFAIGLGLFAGIRWFPYEYAFINPIAGIRHDQRDWELDYWGLSAREGIERLRTLGVSEVGMLPSNDPGEPFGGRDLESVQGGSSPYGTYVYYRWDAALPEACTPAFTITRDGHDLGVGGICTP